MSIENSKNLKTTSAMFLSSNKFYFSVTGSTLTFHDTTFQNDMDQDIRAAIFEECTITLTDNTFQNLHYTDLGGAIDTLNSQVTITGGTFKNNTAPKGGAVAFRCEEGNTCAYNVSGVTFIENTATTDGGAMYYDFFKPATSGNTYTNNQASYGPELAGYPVKIEAETIPTQVYVSGQPISDPIQYKLVDHDGHTIATDSDSVITMSPVKDSDKVIGNTDVTVNKGVATFKDVTFISGPGAKGVSFTVSSSNIDETKIGTAFSMNINQTIQTLTLDFRDCIVGEEKSNNLCTP
jgi:predicted outer membrane repeat protein